MADRVLTVVDQQVRVAIAGGALIAALAASSAAAAVAPYADRAEAAEEAIRDILDEAGEVQGSGSVTFQQAGTGAGVRSVQDKLRDMAVSVEEFGAVGDMDRVSGAGTDNTTLIQSAFEAAIANTGGRLHLPAGRYKITDTLEVFDKIIMTTDGPDVTELVMVTATPKAMIKVNCADNDSIIGLDLKDLRYVCDGFGHGVNCDAVEIVGGSVNSQFHSCYIRDNEIYNCRRGISIDAVFYRCIVQNNTFSRYFGGDITEYGIYSDSLHDVTYNIFINNEVTSVADGAYAYWIRSNYSEFINNTADGACYFSSPGGEIHGLKIETINASSVPDVPAPFSAVAGDLKPVVILNQMQVVSGVVLVGVTNAKADLGILMIGGGTINSPRLTAPQPNNLIKFADGSEGVLNAPYVVGSVGKLEDVNSAANLSGWVLNACGNVSKRTTTPTAWPTAPGFVGWAVNPTISSTTYVVNGAQLTAVINGRGGKITSPGAEITNLPISPAYVGTATLHSSSDATKSATGSVFPGNTSVLSLPVIDLTANGGEYWQATITCII